MGGVQRDGVSMSATGGECKQGSPNAQDGGEFLVTHMSYGGSKL